jgi:hypothetical protein
MNMFEGLDIAAAAEIDYTMPKDTYHCVTSAKYGPTKSGDKYGILLTVTVADGKYRGRSVSRWYRRPRSEDTDQRSPEDIGKDVSRLKEMMLGIGIPLEEINSADADTISNREVLVYISVRPGSDGTNQNTIGRITPFKGDPTSFTGF